MQSQVRGQIYYSQIGKKRLKTPVGHKTLARQRDLETEDETITMYDLCQSTELQQTAKSWYKTYQDPLEQNRGLRNNFT